MIYNNSSNGIPRVLSVCIGNDGAQICIVTRKVVIPVNDKSERY